MLKKVLLALALLTLALLTLPASADQQANVQFLNSPPITCANTATLVAGARFRSGITLTVPTGGATVYVGSSNAVTTSTGFPLAANAALTLQPYNGPVYCIVSSGTQTLNFVESF